MDVSKTKLPDSISMLGRGKDDQFYNGVILPEIFLVYKNPSHR